MSEASASLVIRLCAAAVFAAVLANFLSRRASGVKREDKNAVATGTMTLFFLLVYAVIKLRVGAAGIAPGPARSVMTAAGLAAVVLGATVNILGRLSLGGNWSNEAVIYREHRLVTSGVYGWVRHPLYASLVWMFFGASLVYANAAAFLLSALVFLPFMVHRARLEESMLSREFDGYADYRRRVGMLFWRPSLAPGTASKRGTPA